MTGRDYPPNRWLGRRVDPIVNNYVVELRPLLCDFFFYYVKLLKFALQPQKNK